ncbi:hypothetical protein ABFZ85_04200 [Hyphococcus formosus]|uniref:hypothetical protein n=1 Tax=Hyphococcus formosus TaxID=3143534 RepID=UPI00398AA5BB
MASQIIPPETSDSETVQLDSGEAVSMKVVQSLYNDITGKTESIAQTFTDNHEVTYDDLVQLNRKICQLYEQYNIIATNCNATLYFIDDSKETFSSFDRFSFYNKGSPNPCENLSLEYDILIRLPETHKPQKYKILINLHSRAAIHEKARKENNDLFHNAVIRFIHRNTGSYKIEYVDYTVARNFKHAIDEWYQSLEKHPKSNIVSLAQKHSENFPIAFSVLTSCFLIWRFFLVSKEHMREDSSVSEVFPIAVIGFGTIFVLSKIAFRLGFVFERFIDSYQTISSLKLNVGDEKAILQFKKENLRNLRGGIFSFLIAVIASIVANFILGQFSAPNM